MANGTEERPGRETRLLMLVVGVSVAVLLLLARLRFPSAELATVTPSAAPLAGLVTRATFDDMAGSMTDVLSHVSASVTVVQLEPVPQPPTARARRSGSQPPPPPPELRWMPALRVESDLAVFHLPAGFQVAPTTNANDSVALVAADFPTGIAIVRVPSSTGVSEDFSRAWRGFAGPSYVAVVEGTPGGPSVQPVFIGRADAVVESPWSQPVLRVPPQPWLAAGTWVFGMTGRLIGLTLGTGPATRIIPADAVQELVMRLVGPGASN